MADKFAGRIHVLQSKVWISLQDMRTDISLHKHTQDSFVILCMYLFIYLKVYELLLLLFTYSPHPANIPYCSLAVFTTTLTKISYIKNKKYLKF
jgi:hypothetical protein